MWRLFQFTVMAFVFVGPSIQSFWTIGDRLLELCDFTAADRATNLPTSVGLVRMHWLVVPELTEF